MRMTIRAVGHAVEYFPGGKDRFDLEVDGPLTIADLLEKLEVKRVFVMAAIVDGQRRDLDFRIDRDGAEVVLITPPAGG